MISKKLLSEVLNEILDGEQDIAIENSRLKYFTKHSPFMNYINIYELAHKCKEWAYNKKLSILTHPMQHLNNYSKIWVCEIVSIRDFNRINHPNDFIYAKTEPEAIFKACEWILEQKDRP